MSTSSPPTHRQRRALRLRGIAEELTRDNYPRSRRALFLAFLLDSQLPEAELQRMRQLGRGSRAGSQHEVGEVPEHVAAERPDMEVVLVEGIDTPYRTDHPEAQEAGSHREVEIGDRVAAYLLRLLPRQPGRNAHAMRSVHRQHVRDTAALYRASASQKRLGLALGLDQSNACRLVNGETPSAFARAAEDAERMELAGIPSTSLLAYIHRVVRDARHAWLAKQQMGQARRAS